MSKVVARVSAVLIALLFLVTSLGFSLLVIWQQHQQDKTSQQANHQPQTTHTKLQGSQLSNFTPLSKIDKLQVIDLTPGSGAIVKSTDTVTVNYTGAVAATGTIFQSSLDTGQPVAFPLSQVIKGWTEGIPGMKVGGTRRLLIPSAEAYGTNPPQGSGIPVNADLVFDVQLLKIGQ